MGTSILKGHTKFYRSIGQNLMIAARLYDYNNGYFGSSSSSSGSRTRNIISSDNLQTAQEFYNTISLGGYESSFNNGKLKITTMADGTYITMRTFSNSDGTPVVEINIEHSKHSGGIKKQKIHFVKED